MVEKAVSVTDLRFDGRNLADNLFWKGKILQKGKEEIQQPAVAAIFRRKGAQKRMNLRKLFATLKRVEEPLLQIDRGQSSLIVEEKRD